MKSVLRATLALGLLASALAARAQDAQAVYAKAVPSVMTVNTVARDGKAYIGTAFLAISDGLAVTAWHVVADAKSVTVRFSDGEEFESTGLVDKDERRDLALIRVRVKGRPMLNFAEGDPPVGSKAYALGTPKGLEFSISEGIISAVRQVDGMRQYQYSAPTNHGNSGGPVLAADATVLGVVSYKIRDTEGLNFAIPGAYVKALDATLPTQPWGTQTLSAPKGKAATAEDQKVDQAGMVRLLDLRIEIEGFRAAQIDLEREAVINKSDKFRIPATLTYAIPGLKRVAKEMRGISFATEDFEGLAEISARYAEEVSQRLSDLKIVAEAAMEVGWERQIEGKYEDRVAELKSMPPIWSPILRDAVLNRIPPSEMDRYPKDLIAIVKGDRVDMMVRNLGFILDVRQLPLTVIGDYIGDSPADKAGFRFQDQVLSVNGQSITDWSSFEAALIAGKGKTLSIVVRRAKGPNKTFRLKV